MDGRILRAGRASVADARAALFAVVLLVLLAASLGACGVRGDTDGDEATVLTETDNGRTIAAAVGDALTIRLSENPSTGYRWQVTISRGLVLTTDEVREASASPQLVGAPGTRELTFEVTGAGTQRVTAVYARPWGDGDAAGRQEFSLTIEVE